MNILFLPDAIHIAVNTIICYKSSMFYFVHEFMFVMMQYTDSLSDTNAICKIISDFPLSNTNISSGERTCLIPLHPLS